MVTNVLFAIFSPNAIPVVCGELATAIVENKASQYQVGLVVFGDESHEYVSPVQKLTVAVVNSMRDAAHAAFVELGQAPETKAGDDTEFVEHAELVVRELPSTVNACVIIPQSGTEYIRALDAHCDVSVLPFGHGRKRVPGPKQVKAVKTFEGSFTVGDPEKPLLDIPAVFYPVTRKSTPPDSALFVENRRIVRSSALKTESGSGVEPRSLERGYMYLNELIPVDEGVQNLMDGEFPGAERWGKAFELLATVPEVPPWLPMEHTDVVLGTTPAAVTFFNAFAEALTQSKMHAIARLCRDPRRGHNGEKKLKGKLELVVLQPAANGQLLCSPLPFKEDFKSYYQFAELASEPAPDEVELDRQMDELVTGMELDSVPRPPRNALIERISLFIRDKIADGTSRIPPVPQDTLAVKPDEHLTNLSLQLMAGFGIVERTNTNEPAEPAGTEFEFI